VRCDTTQFGRLAPTFRRDILHPFSETWTKLSVSKSVTLNLLVLAERLAYCFFSLPLEQEHGTNRNMTMYLFDVIVQMQWCPHFTQRRTPSSAQKRGPDEFLCWKALKWHTNVSNIVTPILTVTAPACFPSFKHKCFCFFCFNWLLKCTQLRIIMCR
jgi:hypothetical protein